MKPVLIPPMLPPNILAPQTPISHIYWEVAINIAKLPPTPKKNMTPNTDAPDADDNDYANSPYAADYDADYTKPIQLSLRNFNRNF